MKKFTFGFAICAIAFLAIAAVNKYMNGISVVNGIFTDNLTVTNGINITAGSPNTYLANLTIWTNLSLTNPVGVLSSSGLIAGSNGLSVVAGTRTLTHTSTATTITNSATLTGTTYGNGLEQYWYNGTNTGTIWKTNGDETFNGAVRAIGGLSSTNSNGRWGVLSNGVVTLGPTNAAATITLDGGSGNVSASGVISGNGSGLTNLTIAQGSPGNFSVPAYISWSNAPVWVGDDGIFDEFKWTQTPTLYGGVLHTANSGTSTFTTPAATSLIGRNGFWRNVLPAPGGAAQYVTLTYGNGNQCMWGNQFFSCDFTIESSLTNLFVMVGMMDQLFATGGIAGTNMTKGAVWELNTANTTNFVVRTGGASKAAWTNSSPAALNTWYRLGFYGNTNWMVFTINDSPVWTNTDNTTLPGYQSSLYVQTVVTNSKTNATGGANNIVFWDKIKYVEY